MHYALNPGQSWEVAKARHHALLLEAQQERLRKQGHAQAAQAPSSHLLMLRRSLRFFTYTLGTLNARIHIQIKALRHADSSTEL
jgi:hypothetical protein